MTTTVVVRANHGWPVKVTGVDPVTKEPTMGNYGGIVPAGEARDFICHSDMDLHIHEIQAAEIDQTATAAAE
ncbi:hypothetical protein G6K93_05815 [Agrobacterium rhizogenes]|nr:hypothetical protein [Rhizobium rhizogenes]NTJ46530.1 hypothetical protein [Rhizobium rhizogenes]